jgi:hypothetical protein
MTPILFVGIGSVTGAVTAGMMAAPGALAAGAVFSAGAISRLGLSVWLNSPCSRLRSLARSAPQPPRVRIDG